MRCLILHYSFYSVLKFSTHNKVLLKEVHLVLLKFEKFILCVLLSPLNHLLDIVLVFRHLFHHLFLSWDSLSFFLQDIIDLILETSLVLTHFIDFVNNQLHFLIQLTHLIFSCLLNLWQKLFLYLDEHICCDFYYLVFYPIELVLVLVSHLFEHAFVLRESLFYLGNHLTLLPSFCLHFPLEGFFKRFHKRVVLTCLNFAFVFNGIKSKALFLGLFNHINTLVELIKFSLHKVLDDLDSLNNNLLKYPLSLLHLDLRIFIGAARLILETMAIINGFIGIKISCNRRCASLFTVILCEELRVLLLRGTWAPWNIVYSSLTWFLVVRSLVTLGLVDLVFRWQDILEPTVVSWRLGAVSCPTALVTSDSQILVARGGRWSYEIADHLMPRWRGRGRVALSPIVILNFQVGCWALPLVLNDHL